MPVKIKCNSCGEELTLPDGSAGKQFSCPRCRAKFTMSGGANPGQSVSVNMKSLPAPPPAPAAGRTSGVHSDEELASFIDAEHERGGTPQRESTTAVAAPRGTALSVEGRSADPTKQSTSARFIIADATARQFDLGASGQLPSLVLDESRKKEPAEEKPEGSKPWLLLAVVLGSVGLSVILLLFDATGGVGESSAKADARRKVAERYVEQLAPTKPCQPLLARAIQAYNRGDRAEERRLYRRVLDLLHSEGKDPNEGITGAIQSDALPNDNELQELLSILLRE